MRLLLAFLFLATCLLPAIGQDATPAAPSEAAVRQLVRQLDAAELAEREASEKKLLEMGPAVLPLLPEPNAKQSAELKQRLDRLRNQLQRARDRAFAEGTRVTLKGEFTLAEILAEVEKQTSNKLIDYRDQFGQETDNPTLNVSLDDVSFWEAMDQIMDQAHLVPYPYADQQALALVSLEDPSALHIRNADYIGAFRVEGTKLVADRDLREPRKHSLTLTLEAQWEPRLRPIAIVQAMEDIVATDDTGETMDVAIEEATFETPLTPGTSAAELIVPLFPPSEEATTIESIKGRLTALLPGGEETFEFADLEKAKNVEERRGGALVTLQEARKNNELWEVRVVVSFDDPAGALESHRGWIFNNETLLQTADGQQLKPDGYETIKQTETEVGVAYFFDTPTLAGAKLIYRTPTLLIQMPLEYELHDLPLP